MIDLYCVTAYRNTVDQFFTPKTVALKLWKFLIDDLKSLGSKKIQWKIIFECNHSCYVLIDLYLVTASRKTIGLFFTPKTVALKLWKFLIDDQLKSLGAKKFNSKSSSSAINHIMYWQIDIGCQLIDVSQSFIPKTMHFLRCGNFLLMKQSLLGPGSSMANYLPVQSIMLCIDWLKLWDSLYQYSRSVFCSKDCCFKAVEVPHWWPKVSWCQEVQKQFIFQYNQSCYVLIYLFCVTAYINTVGQFFIPKTVVLKLWKFLIDDLKFLGAKGIQWQIIFRCNQSRYVLIS